jgi:hypothetical protein
MNKIFTVVGLSSLLGFIIFTVIGIETKSNKIEENFTLSTCNQNLNTLILEGNEITYGEEKISNKSPDVVQRINDLCTETKGLFLNETLVLTNLAKNNLESLLSKEIEKRIKTYSSIKYYIFDTCMVGDEYLPLEEHTAYKVKFPEPVYSYEPMGFDKSGYNRADIYYEEAIVKKEFNFERIKFNENSLTLRISTNPETLESESDTVYRTYCNVKTEQKYEYPENITSMSLVLNNNKYLLKIESE